MVSRKSQCDAKLEKGERESRGPDEERARAKATWRRVETLVAPFPALSMFPRGESERAVVVERRRKTREENEGAQLRSRLSSLRLTEELRLGSIAQARRPTAGWLAGLAWRTQRAYRATHRDHSPEPSPIQSQRFSFSAATQLITGRNYPRHGYRANFH